MSSYPLIDTGPLFNYSPSTMQPPLASILGSIFATHVAGRWDFTYGELRTALIHIGFADIPTVPIALRPTGTLADIDPRLFIYNPFTPGPAMQTRGTNAIPQHRSHLKTPTPPPSPSLAKACMYKIWNSPSPYHAAAPSADALPYHCRTSCRREASSLRRPFEPRTKQPSRKPRMRSPTRIDPDPSSTKKSDTPHLYLSHSPTLPFTENVDNTRYPDGFIRPKPELHVNTKQHNVRRRSSSTAMSPTSPHPSIRLGISGSDKPAVNPFTMSQLSPRSEPPHNKPGEKDRAGGGSDPCSSLAQQSFLAACLEFVAPLKVSANPGLRVVDQQSPVVVDPARQASCGTLRLHIQQTIAWANKSAKQKDRRTLVQVIRLAFDKTTADVASSDMYARLCPKMMEQMDPDMHDDRITNNEAKPVARRQLFCKYLLNHCQDDFERRSVPKAAAVAAARTKAAEDQAAKAAVKRNNECETIVSDAYYAAQNTNRQYLGLIRFVAGPCELQTLAECTCTNEIESLFKLLTTVDHILDTLNGPAHVDVYFSRMRDLTKNPNVNFRMQFILQHIVDWREHKSILQYAVDAPPTLASIHEQIRRKTQIVSRTLLIAASHLAHNYLTPRQVSNCAIDLHCKLALEAEIHVLDHGKHEAPNKRLVAAREVIADVEDQRNRLQAAYQADEQRAHDIASVRIPIDELKAEATSRAAL
ncbi:hypothetical protein C8T65DRAFT_696687 [Cerioporus squamosus]|nr:hypothetical protein C8T65DRAFT_696687 [Cerioporus squamosus]